MAQPDQIVISTGYAQGIALLVGVLAARGATRLALEDPSSGDARCPPRGGRVEVTGFRSTGTASGWTCWPHPAPMPSC